MLTYDFRDRGNETLYEYLYRKIRQDILTGELRPRERMPSRRAFARNLGVSVVTVETAYSQLAAEGYLESRPRSGYYVEQISRSMILPGGQESIPGRSPIQTESRPSKASRLLPEGLQTNAGKQQTEIRPSHTGRPRQENPPVSIDLSQSGIPSDMFPFPVWSKLMREILGTRREELLTRPPGNGIGELRSAIAHFLLQYQNLRVSPEQIVIGAGTEYLYSLLIRLLGHDKVYAVETPGYRKTERIYRSSSVEVRNIPMDRSGMDIDLLRQSDADVVHISPSHQFPTGITMPVTRRGELLSWCMEADAGHRRYIIEDDYDSEFRLAGRPIPSLMSIDRSGSVIYLNTFTKSVSPAIRISYMVLPEGLLQEYRQKLGFYSCTVANFEQYILAEFIRRGHFEKHINRMRNYYRQKRDRLLGALRKSRLKDSLDVHGADAGLHFLVTVNALCSEEVLTQRAEQKGIRIYGLSHYEALQENTEVAGKGPAGNSTTQVAEIGGNENAQVLPCMVVNYPGLTDEQIDALPELLQQAWAGLPGLPCL